MLASTRIITAGSCSQGGGVLDAPRADASIRPYSLP